MSQPAESSVATRRRRSSGPRLGELIDAFLDQLASGGASTHTLGAYRRDLRGVADRLATAQGLDDVCGLRLSQVDAAGLEEGMAAWSSFFTYLGFSQDKPKRGSRRLNARYDPQVANSGHLRWPRAAIRRVRG